MKTFILGKYLSLKNNNYKTSRKRVNLIDLELETTKVQFQDQIKPFSEVTIVTDHACKERSKSPLSGISLTTYFKGIRNRLMQITKHQ